MIIKILALTILTEALIELIFTAAPLQGPRQWLIKKTPVLHSAEQGHLLECKYCSSVWIAVGVVLIAMFFDNQVTRVMAGIIIIARLSNYAHLMISSLRDVQINVRLKRK